MKILAVVNPISGGVDKEPFLRHLQQVFDKYGIKGEVFRTTGEQDDEALQLALQNFEPDRLLSLGGDGTTLFTAQNLMHTNCPFGIIPLGSANGMALELGINGDPKVALDEFLKSHIIAGLDLVLVNEKHYCLHIGDVGINARIVERFSEDPERGMFTYAKYFISEIEKADLLQFTIETEENTIKTEGLMLAIANSRKYGTGAVLNYEGNPMDGRLELVVIKKVDSSALLKAGLSIFNENFAKDSDAETISCTKASITLNTAKTLQLDGEVIGKLQKFKVRVLPSAVRLITSTDNPFINKNH